MGGAASSPIHAGHRVSDHGDSLAGQGLSFTHLQVGIKFVIYLFKVHREPSTGELSSIFMLSNNEGVASMREGTASMREGAAGGRRAEPRVSFPHLYFAKTCWRNIGVPPFKMYFSRICGMREMFRCARSVNPKDVLQVCRMCGGGGHSETDSASGW